MAEPFVLVAGLSGAVVAAAVAGLADRWAAALAGAASCERPPSAPTVAVCAAAGFGFGSALGMRGADIVAVGWALVVAAPLVLVALIDLRTRLIPLAAVAAVGVLGLARAAAEDALVASAIGMLVGAAIFALLWAAALPLRARAGTTPFGMGDVLLAAGIGAVAGWPSVLPTLFLGAVFGAFGAIALLASRSARATDAIPYGVFLGAAAILAELART